MWIDWGRAEESILHCLLQVTPSRGYLPSSDDSVSVIHGDSFSTPITVFTAPSLRQSHWAARLSDNALEELGDDRCGHWGTLQSPICSTLRSLSPCIFCYKSTFIILLAFQFCFICGWFVPAISLRDIFLCHCQASVFQGHFAHRKWCFCCFYKWTLKKKIKKKSLHYIQTTVQIHDHANLFWHDRSEWGCVINL